MLHFGRIVRISHSILVIHQTILKIFMFYGGCSILVRCLTILKVVNISV
ncbi:hypothetical protein HMPREF0208_04981 [Citrobacter koseri]|nr:hypothetical protein HMPREF0208_04981 [Citrobacter koseri]